MKKLVVVAVAICAGFTVTAISQTPATAQDGSSKPLAWDVISIKPHRLLDASSNMRLNPDGIEFHNMAISALLLNAFAVRSENQITGYPAWVNSERFDIQAKMDADTAAQYAQLRGGDGGRQWRALVQQILDERFALKFHMEKRELPVYNLVVAKQGLKLKESGQNDDGSLLSSRGKFTAHRCQMESLALSLSGPAGGVVIDRTELTASYNIDLNWSPDDAADTGPSIFTALQDQAGLKLEPAKAPLNVVVVDHIERPSEN